MHGTLSSIPSTTYSEFVWQYLNNKWQQNLSILPHLTKSGYTVHVQRQHDQRVGLKTTSLVELQTAQVCW